VEDWEGILNAPDELAAAQQRAVAETRPVWDVLAELSFHSAVAKDGGAAQGKTVPQMVPAVQPTPTPTLTPTATETATPAPTGTPTLVAPTATFTRVPPTATFTPVPQPFVDFTADANNITVGNCTTLRWNSGNIQALFLNNQGVVGQGEQQVCPSVTTTYIMTATYAGGEIKRDVTVTVMAGAPPPSTPPNFGAMTSSNNQWYDAIGCGPSATTINIIINNATSATIFYRLFPSGGTPTGWSSKPVSFMGGNNWGRSLQIADMPQANGTMQWYFTATNAVGTTASTQYAGIAYSACKP
jgi:hypothetical protein